MCAGVDYKANTAALDQVPLEQFSWPEEADPAAAAAQAQEGGMNVSSPFGKLQSLLTDHQAHGQVCPSRHGHLLRHAICNE